MFAPLHALMTIFFKYQIHMKMLVFMFEGPISNDKENKNLIPLPTIFVFSSLDQYKKINIMLYT